MSMTTSIELPPAVREYYERLILMTAFPRLIHGRFAQKKTMPTKEGDTIIFRRYSKMDTVPIALNEGITPPGAQLSVTDIKARIDWYGNFVTFTNRVMETVQDKVLNECTKLLAQNMGQTIDEITRDVLVSTSSVLLCSNGVNLGTPTELTKADIDAATKTLLSNDAQMITEVIKGTNAFATAPIRPSFWGMIHTDLLDDLESVSNFVATANYSSQEPVQDGEWGNTGNVRWLYSSVASVSGATPPVYNNIIVGKEAYAMVHLGSATGTFTVKQLGSAGSADPLDQRGSVGWSHPFVCRILNDSYMMDLMATHS